MQTANTIEKILPLPIPSPKPLPPPSPKALSLEECCRNGGVPQMCMGLCMDPKGPASRNLPGSWVNACKQYEQTIENCFATGTYQKIISTVFYDFKLVLS